MFGRFRIQSDPLSLNSEGGAMVLSPTQFSKDSSSLGGRQKLDLSTIQPVKGEVSLLL